MRERPWLLCSLLFPEYPSVQALLKYLPNEWMDESPSPPQPHTHQPTLFQGLFTCALRIARVFHPSTKYFFPSHLCKVDLGELDCGSNQITEQSAFNEKLMWFFFSNNNLHSSSIDSLYYFFILSQTHPISFWLYKILRTQLQSFLNLWFYCLYTLPPPGLGFPQAIVSSFLGDSIFPSIGSRIGEKANLVTLQ